MLCKCCLCKNNTEMRKADKGAAGDIDGEAFTGSLPNNKQSDYSRRQNLQFIHDKVQEFLEDRGKSFNALAREDLEKMAGDEPNPSVARFLKLVLTVMLESPTMTDQVQKIMTLPAATQEIVGGLMQEVADFESDVEAGSREDEDESHDKSQSAFAPPQDTKMDQVFQLEQQYAKIMSQLERRNQEFKDLEAELEKLGKSLARSQETNDALNNEIAERDEQLKKARSMNSDREYSSIKDLETKISQQEESIASKESQMSKLQANFTELQRENKKHSAARDKVAQLQDEIDVMKMELEKQTRKANTADKYMQKLQASQGVEKERDSLRQDLEEARTQLAGTAKLRQENAALQQSNDESSRILSQIEQEHDELRMTKKQLRVNYDSLARQVDALNERFAQDQETIADLRDRHGASDRISSTAMNGGLEGELNETSKQEDQMKLRIAELEKQAQRLKSDVQEKDTKKTTLQRQLNIAMEKSADHSGQVQGLREEILTLQTSLAEVKEGHPIEGTETFKRMRDQVKAEERKRMDLEKELATTRTNTNVSVAEKPPDILDKRESNTDGLDMRALTEMIQQASAGQSAGDLSDAVASKLDNILGGKIEAGKAELAKQQEVSKRFSLSQAGDHHANDHPLQKLDTQASTIKDLEESLHKQEKLATEAQRKADALASQPQPQQQSSAHDRFHIQNLERELKLMASAYHDLAGRLQMNNVVLQRRAEAPRSWLGRQRKAMEGPTGLSR